MTKQQIIDQLASCIDQIENSVEEANKTSNKKDEAILWQQLADTMYEVLDDMYIRINELNNPHLKHKSTHN